MRAPAPLTFSINLNIRRAIFLVFLIFRPSPPHVLLNPSAWLLASPFVQLYVSHEHEYDYADIELVKNVFRKKKRHQVEMEKKRG
jgi:hypothetical protein